MQGIRQTKMECGEQLYFIKRKEWVDGAMTVYNMKNKDIFIVANPNQFRNWHNSKIIQCQLLHEFGHMSKNYKNHFIDELHASFYGFFNYREMFKKLSVLDFIRFLRASWKAHIRPFNNKKHEEERKKKDCKKIKWEKVTDPNYKITRDTIVKVGKRKFLKINVKK